VFFLVAGTGFLNTKWMSAIFRKAEGGRGIGTGGVGGGCIYSRYQASLVTGHDFYYICEMRRGEIMPPL
jgi:hypothetical protein